MQLNEPLSPALSPFHREREKTSTDPAASPNGDRSLRWTSHSLSPRSGERVRERGSYLLHRSGLGGARSICRCRSCEVAPSGRALATLLPLPKGEGRGEGERGIRIASCRRLLALINCFAFLLLGHETFGAEMRKASSTPAAITNQTNQADTHWSLKPITHPSPPK